MPDPSDVRLTPEEIATFGPPWDDVGRQKMLDAATDKVLRWMVARLRREELLYRPDPEPGADWVADVLLSLRSEVEGLIGGKR